MKKDTLDQKYTELCVKLGDITYKQALLDAQKSSLIKQIAELQQKKNMLAELETKAEPTPKEDVNSAE